MFDIYFLLSFIHLTLIVKNKINFIENKERKTFTLFYCIHYIADDYRLEMINARLLDELICDQSVA